MKKEEILNAVKSLASGSGFYCRLYNHLVNNDEALTKLESENFTDIISMIFFFEC